MKVELENSIKRVVSHVYLFEICLYLVAYLHNIRQQNNS